MHFKFIFDIAPYLEKPFQHASGNSKALDLIVD